MNFSEKRPYNLRALAVKTTPNTGISATRHIVLPPDTLTKELAYADDEVFIKLKLTTALNEIAVAEWAAALDWRVVPAIVDPALVFVDTVPESAIVMRWIKNARPLADVSNQYQIESTSFKQNRIFELLIRKGDRHEWNTLSNNSRRTWWSIDHDFVDLSHDVPAQDKRFGDLTDKAVSSPYGQRLLKKALNRDLPPVLEERVHELIVTD